MTQWTQQLASNLFLQYHPYITQQGYKNTGKEAFDC